MEAGLSPTVDSPLVQVIAYERKQESGFKSVQSMHPKKPLYNGDSAGISVVVGTL